jgi:hypothetical protein
MKKTLLALVSVLSLSTASEAQVIAQWNFSDFGANVTNATFGPVAATGGANAAGAVLNAVHNNALSVWSHPVGNGNPDSLSVNNWTAGDYFEFNLATTSFTDISFSFDQNRSGTGPTNFSFRYSLDGVSFTSFADYEVAAVSWTGTSSNAASTFLYNLGAVTDLNQQSSVYFRLVNLDSPAGGGTTRVDNIIVTGVPEPSTYALLALSGIALAGYAIRRRRRAGH